MGYLCIWTYIDTIINDAHLNEGLYLPGKYFIMELVSFWHCDNDWIKKKNFFHEKWTLYLVKYFNHLKLKYTDPWNFLTTRTLASQPCALVDAKGSNISHYLNSSIYLSTIILAIVLCIPNMIVPYTWTSIWWLSLPNWLIIVR